jgi:hypothetical protein
MANRFRCPAAPVRCPGSSPARIHRPTSLQRRSWPLRSSTCSTRSQPAPQGTGRARSCSSSGSPARPGHGCDGSPGRAGRRPPWTPRRGSWGIAGRSPARSPGRASRTPRRWRCGRRRAAGGAPLRPAASGCLRRWYGQTCRHSGWSGRHGTRRRSAPPAGDEDASGGVRHGEICTLLLGLHTAYAPDRRAAEQATAGGDGGDRPHTGMGDDPPNDLRIRVHAARTAGSRLCVRRVRAASSRPPALLLWHRWRPRPAMRHAHQPRQVADAIECGRQIHDPGRWPRLAAKKIHPISSIISYGIHRR